MFCNGTVLNVVCTGRSSGYAYLTRTLVGTHEQRITWEWNFTFSKHVNIISDGFCIDRLICELIWNIPKKNLNLKF